MDNPIVAIVFGVLLIGIGVSMLIAQRKASRTIEEESPPDAERRFLQRRIRRRTQVAGIILLIGIMIPLGDSVIEWRNAVGTFAIYWIIVIALACWTGLLAIGDIVATRAHMANEMNRLHRHNLDLEKLAREIKEQQRKRSSD